MKKCPYCAEEIQDEAVKCRYCREWLEKKAEPIPTEWPSPQQSTVTAEPTEERNVKTENLYEAYLGEKNSIYYLSKFKEFDGQGPGLKASWNWAAFFGFLTWALYRKMYGWFFALFAYYSVLTIIDQALTQGGFYVISFLLSLVPLMVFGFFANSLYYRNVKKKIADAQLLISDESKLLEFLHNKGGVHTWVIWVCIGIWVIVLLFWSVFSIINLNFLPILFVSLISGVPIIAILYANINVDWEIKLQDIWSQYKAYMIIVPIVIIVAGILFTILLSHGQYENWKVFCEGHGYTWLYDKNSIHYPQKEEILGLTVRNKEIVNVWVKKGYSLGESSPDLLTINCASRTFECSDKNQLCDATWARGVGYRIETGDALEGLLKKICP